eukprot:CAMPEP_0170106118 /NCGR_PEP_ID=MMETSP0020_2-20130122/5181_1 /TAXON_ID=98059 /ORGANISM="Dinobryon sp., Strain UTEXLB2267" /LENGTH=176 /DNA_ID=CAMNT_0010330379 /DNA_START=1128 /DNA_END=1658 /DNA_ORIENTATION=-
MGKHGLLRIQHASKSAVSTKTVKDSFCRAGIYNSKTTSYDLKQILSNCTSTISIEEETHIMEVIPKLAAILNQNGELLDSDFNKYNIRVEESISSKDNLVLSRKRMVLLTNATLVQKEEEKRKKKEEDKLQNLEKKRVRKEKAEAKKTSKVAKKGNVKSVHMRENKQSDVESDEEW